MTPFKDIFRAARLAKGLQQKDLAEKLDISAAYVSRLEKGLSLPSNDLIILLCHEFGLDTRKVWVQVTLEKTDNEQVRIMITGIQNILESIFG